MGLVQEVLTVHLARVLASPWGISPAPCCLRHTPEAITACTCKEAKANRTSKWNWKGSWEKALTTEKKLVGNLRFVCVNYSSSWVKAVWKT